MVRHRAIFIKGVFVLAVFNILLLVHLEVSTPMENHNGVDPLYHQPPSLLTNLPGRDLGSSTYKSKHLGNLQSDKQRSVEDNGRTDRSAQVMGSQGSLKTSTKSATSRQYENYGNRNFTHEIFFSKNEPSYFDTKRRPPNIIPRLPLPIFVLNMPKSGTETIQEYFQCGMGKYWAAHHQYRDLEGELDELAICELENVVNDRPMVEGCGRFAVYTDAGYMWKDDDDDDNHNGDKQKKCFYPGVHGLENIAKYYPRATLLHLPRNTTEWIQSSRNHHRILDRYDDYCGGFRNGGNIRTNQTTTDKMWADWYEKQYTARIREFARSHPPLTYVESPLEDFEATGKLLEELTGIPASCYRRHHATKEKKKVAL